MAGTIVRDPEYKPRPVTISAARLKMAVILLGALGCVVVVITLLGQGQDLVQEYATPRNLLVGVQIVWGSANKQQDAMINAAKLLMVDLLSGPLGANANAIMPKDLEFKTEVELAQVQYHLATASHVPENRQNIKTVTINAVELLMVDSLNGLHGIDASAITPKDLVLKIEVELAQIQFHLATASHVLENRQNIKAVTINAAELLMVDSLNGLHGVDASATTLKDLELKTEVELAQVQFHPAMANHVLEKLHKIKVVTINAVKLLMVDSLNGLHGVNASATIPKDLVFKIEAELAQVHFRHATANYVLVNWRKIKVVTVSVARLLMVDSLNGLHGVDASATIPKDLVFKIEIELAQVQFHLAMASHVLGEMHKIKVVTMSAAKLWMVDSLNGPHGVNASATIPKDLVFKIETELAQVQFHPAMANHVLEKLHKIKVVTINAVKLLMVDSLNGLHGVNASATIPKDLVFKIEAELAQVHFRHATANYVLVNWRKIKVVTVSVARLLMVDSLNGLHGVDASATIPKDLVFKIEIELAQVQFHLAMASRVLGEMHKIKVVTMSAAKLWMVDSLNGPHGVDASVTTLKDLEFKTEVELAQVHFRHATANYVLVNWRKIKVVTVSVARLLMVDSLNGLHGVDANATTPKDLEFKTEAELAQVQYHLVTASHVLVNRRKIKVVTIIAVKLWMVDSLNGLHGVDASVTIPTDLEFKIEVELAQVQFHLAMASHVLEKMHKIKVVTMSAAKLLMVDSLNGLHGFDASVTIPKDLEFKIEVELAQVQFHLAMASHVLENCWKIKVVTMSAANLLMGDSLSGLHGADVYAQNSNSSDIEIAQTLAHFAMD